MHVSRAARSVAVCIAVLATVLLVGCEASTHVTTKIEVPSQLLLGSAPALTRLHVAVCAATSFSQPLDMPDSRCPSYASKQCPSRITEPDLTTFSFSQSRIPSVPTFCASAWFDTNANGIVDSGDAVGQLEHPYPSQPSNFIASNRYDSPPITLVRVP